MASLTSDKVNLLDFDRAGLRAYFESLGEKPFRADQVLKWLYQNAVTDVDQMTNLAKSLRAKLKEHCEIYLPDVMHSHVLSLIHI